MELAKCVRPEAAVDHDIDGRRTRLKPLTGSCSIAGKFYRQRATELKDEDPRPTELLQPNHRVNRYLT
jgi:hypothetical protein